MTHIQEAKFIFSSNLHTYLTIILVCVLFHSSNCQTYTFDFDDCTFEEQGMTFPGITPGGNPTCVCGIGGQGYRLNGVDDFLEFSQQLIPLMDEDFTLDFYFFLEDKSSNFDILSLRETCISFDSLMSLRYSSTGDLIFEMSDPTGRFYSLRTKLDPTKCWHRFTLVKFNLEYFIYVDNKRIGRILARETVSFSRKAKLAFANSPCNTNQNQAFRGVIDNIKYHRRALSDRDVFSDYNYPDRLITQDLTIFDGESIELTIGSTCAASLQWMPSEAIDTSDPKAPIANPSVTTTYYVKFTNPTCQSIDTITIYVADRNDLDCSQLLLPKAFTPNNDGLNDEFGISNTFVIEDLERFDIFDRNGALLWSASSIEDKWDGFFNGASVNSGTYMFKIQYLCNSKSYNYIDTFVLMR